MLSHKISILQLEMLTHFLIYWRFIDLFHFSFIVWVATLLRNTSIQDSHTGVLDVWDMDLAWHVRDVYLARSWQCPIFYLYFCPGYERVTRNFWSDTVDRIRLANSFSLLSTGVDGLGNIEKKKRRRKTRGKVVPKRKSCTNVPLRMYSGNC